MSIIIQVLCQTLKIIDQSDQGHILKDLIVQHNLSFFFKFSYLFWGGGRARRERIPSSLRTDCAELNVGLTPTNHEPKSRVRQKLNHWATTAPPQSFFFDSFYSYYFFRVV